MQDTAIACIDRDVRDRLAGFGEHHQIARAQIAKIRRDGHADACLLARRPRQCHSIFRKYVFRKA